MVGERFVWEESEILNNKKQSEEGWTSTFCKSLNHIKAAVVLYDLG